MSANTAAAKKAEKKKRRADKVQQKEGPAANAGSIIDASSTVKPLPQNAVKGKGDNKPDVSTQRSPPNPDVQTPQPNEASQSVNPKSADKKQLTKADRRALQEAQRKAKLENKKTADKSQANQGPSAQAEQSQSRGLQAKQAQTKEQSGKDHPIKEKTRKEPTKLKTGLLAHLPQNHDAWRSLSRVNIHPMFLKIGLQIAEGKIVGANSRAVALLYALQKLITDYRKPDDKEFTRDMLDYVELNLKYLRRCRPLSVGMTSIVRYLKSLLLHKDLEEHEAKKTLCENLGYFYTDRICVMQDNIAVKASEKIYPGDIIVTFAHSSCVLEVLKYAYHKMETEGQRFSVIIIDSRVWPEGREMLRKLMRACPLLQCSYVHINSLSYVMAKASRVFLGAHAVLANGYVQSRVGSSQVALVAATYNVPVLVCCETYKFSERTQTDSLVNNELGDPSALLNLNGEESELKQHKSSPTLNIYNLKYDFTPPSYVSGIVTETAVIPCTSAPVVLRVKQQYEFTETK